MLDYSALTALVVVIREGSFKRTAHVPHITPSAILQRVWLLGERVGYALAVRDQSRCPTEVSLRLYQHVDRVRLPEREL